MKQGWTYKKLGEVCEVTDYVANGSFATLRENVTYYNEPNYALLVRLADYSSNFDSSKFVYVDKHSYDFLSKSSLFGGEIIMSNVGSIGKCFICPKLAEHMTIGPNSLLIRTPNNKFYLYYFKSKTFQKDLISITSSATLSKFNKTQLKTLSLPSPPLPEQQRIVSRLDSAFAHIDELKANAEKQVNEARALFQKALSKAMEPKDGWEEKKIGDIFQTYAGGTPLKSGKGYYEGGNIPWIRSGEVCKMYIKDCEMYITEEGMKNSSAKYYPINTVLVAMYGATAAQVGILKFKATSNQAVCGILPNKKFVPEYIYYWFKGIQEKLASQAQGGAQPNLSQVKIKKVLISYPSLPEQQRIVERLDALSKNVKALEENQRKVMAECDALKQALLRKVFE